MSRFQTTRWSLIEQACEAPRDHPSRARDALELLCRAYRPPVLAFIRHSGYANQAEDLTQAFFLSFLERGWYAHADPQRGRFRSLLLTTLKHFLDDQRAAANACKRGGGKIITDQNETIEQIPSDGERPEDVFTREWLQTIVSHAITRLHAEWLRAGKQEQFRQLSPVLAERPDPDALRELSASTGIRANTLAVQAHRMRQRLRQLVRLELLQTVGSPEALELELAELRDAVRAPR